MSESGLESLGQARRELRFRLNGEAVTLRDVDPRSLLIEYLRSRQVGLTGAKLVCGEGGCGACTVMESRIDPRTGGVRERAVNACLRPLCAVDGSAITTVEGVGSVRTRLDPVQQRIAARYGSQCGFCTPGFVMTTVTRLRQGPASEQEIEDLFDGHICRCTGYRAILEAMRSFATDFDPAHFETNHPCELPPGRLPTAAEPGSLCAPARPDPAADALFLDHDGFRWIRPTSLADAQRLKAQLAQAGEAVDFVSGNTSTGVYRPDAEGPRTWIDISRLPELAVLEREPEQLRLGAGVTLSEAREFLERCLAELPSNRRAGLSALHRHLGEIGNLQVRNAGSLGGNLWITLAHAIEGEPFPSDWVTVLGALGARVVVASDGGQRSWELPELPAPGELPDDGAALCFEIPLGRPGERVESFKVARRVQDAHAIVNAAFRSADAEDGSIEDARIVFGGVARLPLRARETEAFLRGRRWDQETLDGALEQLEVELEKGQEEWADSAFYPPGYRTRLALSLFYKFFVGGAVARDPERVSPAIRNVTERPVRPLSTSVRRIQVIEDEQPVGEPLPKLSGFAQATGEAVYPHDLPVSDACLEAAYVLSRRARARFELEGGAAASETALRERFPGVVALVSASDVPGENLVGMGGDDPIFAVGEVSCWGQPVGLVVARSRREAADAAGWLEERRLRYRDLPAIRGIEEARNAPGGPSYFADTPTLSHIHSIERPGSDAAWLADPGRPLPGCRVLHGSHRAADQAQFYLETQSTLAVPEEGSVLRIHSGTQNPSAVQAWVAKALSIPDADVRLAVRRLGGGFGGKQWRPGMVACAAAVAAWRLRRPVRLVLDRDTDTVAIGKRHPFEGEFHVCHSDEGEIRAMTTTFWSDGGNSLDCSFPVMDLAQQNADCAYRIPTFQTRGHICRTNRASNTAMRSFGTVQSVQIQEEAIERVAHAVGRPPEEIRRRQLYRDRLAPPFDRTHFDQELRGCRLEEIWDELESDADVVGRRREIDRFNSAQRWRKRGLSMLPLKYGVGYQPRLLDQAGAHVAIYAEDGSVLVRHGGIEIGQGLHTKMAQIAARALGIPLELVHIGDTWTTAVPNSSATAASTGADLNGGAVQNACRILRARLEEVCEVAGLPLWDARSDRAARWRDAVSRAYASRVDLAAQGFFKSPFIADIPEDRPYGYAFTYFVYAGAVSEVEIDVLTGEFEIRRADILYDAGRSLNPCIDVGQVEGGFVQGVGNVTTEELLYLPSGRLLSSNTWNYKPPCTKTIPVDFRVRLLPRERINPVTGDPHDPAAVQSSKGVGEPSLVLANSVFFAIKHAVLAARRDAGVDEWPSFPAPATVARIQEACRVRPAQLGLR